MRSGVAKILVAAFAFAVLGGTASAQGAGGRHHGKTAEQTPAKPKVDDRAYKAALKQLPDKQFDAWHGVR